jgi:hypothetical protein
MNVPAFVIRKNGALFQPIEITLDIVPHPQPTSHSRRQNPKIFLLSASGNVRNLDLRHMTILYTAHYTAAPSGNTRVYRPERLPHASADPSPAPPVGCPGPPATTGCAECAHFSKTFLDPSAPTPPAHPAAQGNQQPPSPLGTTPCFDNHRLLCHPERSRGTCGAPLGLPEFQGSHGIGSPPYPVTLFSARRVSRGTRPISSGSCSRHLTNC